MMLSVSRAGSQLGGPGVPAPDITKRPIPGSQGRTPDFPHVRVDCRRTGLLDALPKVDAYIAALGIASSVLSSGWHYVTSRQACLSAVGRWRPARNQAVFDYLTKTYDGLVGIPLALAILMRS